VAPGAGLAIDGERIVAVGPDAELAARFQPRSRVDARGGLCLPGFVDAHTHPVFVGTRADEFELRTRGASYAEIAAAGGGIQASVRGVRASSKEELLALLCMRLDRFLELGTTTVEAKSGYGLSLEDERKSLEVIAAANRRHPVDLVPTFLGAHAVPAEHRGRRGDYVRLVIEEMLPRVAADGLAEYCDVFTEAGAFDLAETRAIATAARDLGLGVRLHVDQLSPLGGAELAAELGAASADHLEFVSDAGIAALAAAGVAPVLCPLVPLYLRVEQEAPARRMIAAGLGVVLATDFNPGSCPLQSMPEVLTWAALRYRMSAAEVLTAATLNAAASLGRAADRGTLEVGKRADVVIADVADERQLVAELGRNPVQCVIKSGRVAWQRP
jgi:imidazolonepropionase